MPTKELLPPSEFPKFEAARKASRPTALKAWREFLQPPELETYRIVRDAIANTLQSSQKTSRAREWEPSTKPQIPARRLKVDQAAISAAVDWLMKQDFPPDAGEQIKREAWN